MTRSSLYIRNIIFGVEDGLVSTVGLLSGVALGNVPRSTILLTGVVYIFVEAFSMAVGSFLSEESAQEIENGSALVPGVSPILGGFVIFASSIVAGFIPLVPYLVVSGWAALSASIVLSLAALAILGFTSAVATKARPGKRALRMLVLGGSAIVIGAIVSLFVKAA